MMGLLQRNQDEHGGTSFRGRKGGIVYGMLGENTGRKIVKDPIEQRGEDSPVVLSQGCGDER